MPSDAPPSPATAKKRPWYLVAALIASSVFGVTGSMGGCNTIAFYKETRIDAGSAREVMEIKNEEDRAAAKARVERLFDLRDAGKRRLFPLGVAEMLIGTAMFFLAGRAMAGRLTARNMLLQLVAAQAALTIVTYVITPDVRRAQIEVMGALGSARFREAGEANVNPMKVTEIALAVQLGVQTLASLLIILALTRPRSREFFDAPSDAIEER